MQRIAVMGAAGRMGKTLIESVQQASGAVRGQRHHALEIRQAGDGAQLPEIALQVRLDIGGKPKRAVGVARDGERWRVTASQQPGRPVASFGRPLANIEIGSEEPIERLEGGLPLLPFRGAEGW